MQWDKFKQFTATHLDLAPCLTEQLSPIGGSRSMKDVVEQEVQFIAVRPWASLDLDEKGSLRQDGRSEDKVTYTVYAHIEGNERPCARARTSYEVTGSSVRDIINQLSAWHLEYWALQDNRPLVFDAVTRKTSYITYDHITPTADRKAISFFLFPEGFHL